MATGLGLASLASLAGLAGLASLRLTGYSTPDRDPCAHIKLINLKVLAQVPQL